jgi:hypothetical protein
LVIWGGIAKDNECEAMIDNTEVIILAEWRKFACSLLLGRGSKS